MINYANAKYHKESKTATLSGNPIVIESLTPILTKEQKDLQRKEVEQRLLRYLNENNITIYNIAGHYGFLAVDVL